MKQLTQKDFKESHLDERHTAAAIDANGHAWAITGSKSDFYDTEDNQLCWNFPVKGLLIGSGYDNINWQNSAIDREVKA